MWTARSPFSLPVVQRAPQKSLSWTMGCLSVGMDRLQRSMAKHQDRIRSIRGHNRQIRRQAPLDHRWHRYILSQTLASSAVEVPGQGMPCQQVPLSIMSKFREKQALTFWSTTRSSPKCAALRQSLSSGHSALHVANRSAAASSYGKLAFAAIHITRLTVLTASTTDKYINVPTNVTSAHSHPSASESTLNGTRAAVIQAQTLPFSNATFRGARYNPSEDETTSCDMCGTSTRRMIPGNHTILCREHNAVSSKIWYLRRHRIVSAM